MKRDQLAAKITAMESKLLGGNVKDRSDEAKKALERKRQEVIEQKVRMCVTCSSSLLESQNRQGLFECVSVEKGQSDRNLIKRKRAIWS